MIVVYCVERWHSNASSLHLPIEKLTITLDDVSNLLHLPHIPYLRFSWGYEIVSRDILCLPLRLQRLGIARWSCL